jgi:RNase adaptor protein for sRNA GlmZ degradation
MNPENNTQTLTQENTIINTIETIDNTKQVEEIREAVGASVIETSLPDKVQDLRIMLDNLSQEVDSWRAWHKTDYLEVIETLKSQVEEVQIEWNSLSESIQNQREKLESLIQAAPGVIDTATLKALTLRVSHLEQLVSQIVNESQTKAALKGSKRQYIISLVALGVTIILWGLFFVMNLLK